MSNPVIKLENVSWAYARTQKWALKNISITIDEGEFIAVMGENGAGKTTFCRLLNGLIPHSLPGKLLGTVTVDDIATSSSSVAQLAGKAGTVFDDPETQLFTARVDDEVAFALENLLLPKEEIKERVRWALDAAGLSGYAHHAPAALSGGQKQRLAIAAALAMASKALVLDEPVSQLDPAGAKEVLSFIRDLRTRKGLTVIMTGTSGDEAVEFADKVCILKNGSIAAYDTPRRIFSDQGLLAGIWPPQVSEFAFCMAERGNPLPQVPLNIQEAKEACLLRRQLSPKETRPPKAYMGHLVSERDKHASFGGAVHLENLHYWYNPGKIILNDINLSFMENEFTVILGRNGSGKTTMLKNISGLLRPSKGNIFLGDSNTLGMSVAEIAKEIGFVMQDPDRQLFESTVYNEVAFALKHIVPKQEIQQKTEETLTAIGLSDKRDEFPPALDRADRVKAVFAAVLAMGSKIIMLDEPVAGQDKSGCRLIMDILASLHRQGYTIIMVTHNINVAAEYARRIIVMQDGRVSLDGPPADIFAQTEKLTAAGIIAPQITRLSQSLRPAIPLEKDALTPIELAEMLSAFTSHKPR